MLNLFLSRNAVQNSRVMCSWHGAYRYIIRRRRSDVSGQTTKQKIKNASVLLYNSLHFFYSLSRDGLRYKSFDKHFVQTKAGFVYGKYSQRIKMNNMRQDRDVSRITLHLLLLFYYLSYKNKIELHIIHTYTYI